MGNSTGRRKLKKKTQSGCEHRANNYLFAVAVVENVWIRRARGGEGSIRSLRITPHNSALDQEPPESHPRAASIQRDCREREREVLSALD